MSERLCIRTYLSTDTHTNEFTSSPHFAASRDTNSRKKCAAMAFVVFIPALLNEEATDAPAHGDDLARRHTADLRSVGASWLRCMLGLAADAAAHMLRRVWCHAEKICFDGSSCRSKVRGTGVNRMVRGGRQRHGLPMEHWCSVDVATHQR